MYKLPGLLFNQQIRKALADQAERGGFDTLDSYIETIIVATATQQISINVPKTKEDETINAT